MMKILRNYLILFALSLSVNSAFAATLYIRNGATGRGDGSDWANAYQSLPATLVRGNTYYIADGNYSGRTFNTASNGQIITIKKATVSDHGAETGWQADYGDGQVVFTSGLAFTSPDWLLEGQTGGGPGKWTSGFGFRINQGSGTGLYISTSNITIRHFEIQGQLIDGAIGVRTANSASNITLSYYHMNNIGNCPFALIPVANFVAEYGYVGRFYGSSAAHSEIASIWGGVRGTTTFRYNIFAHVESTGGIMWDNNNDHTARLYVYGNIFYRPSTNTAWNNNANGLVGGWTDGGADMYNMRIFNNSFVNITGRIFTDFVLRSGDNQVYNNLFYNSTAPSYADIQSHDYNHYINSGSVQGEANGTSAASGDPFVDYVNLDFRLKAATAPGITVGSPMTLDMLGAVRGSDGRVDRGALEFGSTIAPPPVPEPTPTPAPTPEPSPVSGISLFTTQTPVSMSNSDGSNVNYELGMRFMSSKAGTIQAIRFFKSPSESGSHTGKIYSASGSLLASVIFSSESGSGWQVQKLSSPLKINANTEYVVSVNTGNTFYVASNSGFSTQIKNGSLMSVVGSAGVYGPVGGKPSSSYMASNYFRDLVFLEDGPSAPAPSPSPVATEILMDNLMAGSQNAQVSFTGQWCTSSVPGSYGNASLYSCGTAMNTYTYKPSIAVSGLYDVYVRHSARASRSASVAISVNTASGAVVKNINQQINGGTWVLHGRYLINAGAGSISVSHVNSSSGDASVDGVRLVPVP